MRINFRILLINFAIVAVILISSVVAFYSLVYNVIENQQSKFLQTSTNNFLYSYNELLKEIETNFLFIKDNSDNQAVLNSKNKNIDFIFSQDKDSSTLKVDYLSEFDFPQKENITLKDFSKNYPQAIVLQYKSNDKTYFYGKFITNSLLNDLSKRINADIALSSSNKIIKLSNNNTGNSIPEDYLKTKSQLFKVNKLNINDRELLANKYEVSLNASGEPAQFIIFSNLDAADKLLRSLNYIISIIGLAGIVLSLILVYLFTDKFRKQIQLLSKATEITGDGKFKNKIKIESKDELGQLANAFNIMVDELEKNQKLTNEYSDFITLIINNPGYASISETALKKIVYTGGFAMGALFRVDDDSVTLTSSYGINKSYFERDSYDFFKPVIDNKETKEVFFNEDAPLINTGFIDIRIKYLIVIPIIYHEKVIAVLELGAVKKPLEETNLYITKIKDQLAIGLVNAAAVTQLENLIKELKNLNEDYHKQNIQVVQQNERLLELHRSLKEKADELEIQKIKAEESTRLKSHFLASISHELRTPMNSILGLTELLLEEKACTGKNKERLEVVVNSGKRLMSLINDILDLSKIEAGKMELHYEDTIIGELLNDIDTSIQPLLSKKDFQFKIIKNVDSRIIINTDKGKITQVLLNLLVNAIKFTEKGYVHLKVNKIENGKIKFDVIDTGIGISKDDQAIIFEEFRQLDGTTTRKYNGTGLGLAISRRIAGMMNGSITVESSLGAGSTFSFEIPVSIVGIKEPQEEIQVEQEKTSKKKNLILIIDSDPKVRYTIGQYLITKGYNVEFADNGIEGMQKAINLQPFAITLDVMLPEHNGWTILRDLKENGFTKDIPIILVSILGEKKLGYGFGAYEYFVKPVSPEKMYKTLIRLENYKHKKIEKIIIVDDDETQFELYKNAFQTENIRIEYIKDSEYAFSKILEAQPDLVVLDVIMKGVDGITLSHKLKTHDETKHIPIILNTEKEISEEEKNSLNNIVESITLKSKTHPLDVLKIVRDRIDIQESDNKKVTEQNIFVKRQILHTDEIVQSYKGEVLIVDDDPDTLFTLNEIVLACGCKTILAKNGKECLELLENVSPNLILLDIMMPEMDGFQAIKKIREKEKNKNIPVFAVTAKAMLEDKAIILRHGFDDYITKPVNSGIMQLKINKVFSKIDVN